MPLPDRLHALAGRVRQARLVPHRRRPRVFLHIGAMKTGTTYLQDLMSANREQLRAAGVLFPGERWAEQSAAAADVLGFTITDPRRRAEVEGSWDRMVEQMTSWRGRASVYSMEFLSFADEEQARRVVESLDGADVHVVLTVRDARGTIPAQWQTTCRNGGRVPFRRFVYGVKEAIDSDGEAGSKPVRMLLRTQGIGRMLGVWTPLVGADHVHVVTVPPRGSDPDLLWKRFAGVVGVRPEVATEPVETSNPSLGHASAELLRRVNVRLAPLDRSDQTAVLKGPLARQILSPRAGQETPIRLHRRGQQFAKRWNRRMRNAIEASGVEVVGSLDDLPLGRPGEDEPRRLHRPSPAEIVDAARTARLGLLDHERWLARRLEQAGGTAVLAEGPVRDGLPAWDVAEPDEDDAAAAADDVAALARSCMVLRRQGLDAGVEQTPGDDGADADDDLEGNDGDDGPDDEDDGTDDTDDTDDDSDDDSDDEDDDPDDDASGMRPDPVSPAGR